MADTEKKLSKTEIQTFEVEGEFREQKVRVDTLSKNIIYLTIKLDEAGSHLASTY